MSATTELHGAFCWDCDECGVENFVRAIEGDIDEAAMAASENQVVGGLAAIPEETGDGYSEAECLQQMIMLAPQHVTCSACGHTFETELIAYGEDL